MGTLRRYIFLSTYRLKRMTMCEVFCCPKLEPYRPRRLDHEPKFTAFMTWAGSVTTSLTSNDKHAPVHSAPYAVQVVRQVNFGAQESIRYFIPASEGSVFAESTEDDLLQANFETLNSYKNFRCATHNRFFDVNLYQKNAINTHHWRATLSRPSRDIDLPFRQKGTESESQTSGKVSERSQQRLPSTSNRETSTLGTPHELVENENETRLSNCSKDPAVQIDIATLTNLLRFLLPTIGTSFSSGRVLSLLALDWINKELALGLDFETRWDAELDGSNIIIFFCDCFEMSVDDASVDLSEVEDLVIPAIRHVELLGGRRIPGRERLQRIVDNILNRNPTVDWVSKYGANVARVLASAPNEELLDRCRLRNSELQQNENSNRVEASHDKYIQMVLTPGILLSHTMASR